MISRASEFRRKEVINITDGKRLGFADDIELNLESGSIDSLVIPGPGKYGFSAGTASI